MAWKLKGDEMLQRRPANAIKGWRRGRLYSCGNGEDADRVVQGESHTPTSLPCHTPLTPIRVAGGVGGERPAEKTVGLGIAIMVLMCVFLP